MNEWIRPAPPGGLGRWASLGVLLLALIAPAQAQTLGDLDTNGVVNVLDLVRLINHVNGTSALAPALRGYADVNGDGFINQADVDMLADAVLGIPITTQPRPLVAEPASGAGEVGVTVRPKVYFPKPIIPATLNSNNFYASFAGQKLSATIVPANDGTFAWLFFDPPMPTASLIQVTVDGSTISVISGEILDADADGAPGGVFTFSFSTVSVVPIPGTVVSSRMVDPGPDMIPRTADDVALGGNGYTYLLPIAGVKVYVLGLESNVAYTDTNGQFTLTNMPVGDVKVVLDGRTATNPPAGYYFPEMVMDTTFSPGVTNGVMTIRDANGGVVRDTNGVPVQALAMYLPRVASNVLQTVSASVTNMIALQSNAAYNLPAEQQPYLTLEVMPNSLIGVDGQPMATGQVGVSVVPPELVKDMLPPGLLQHTFDITVQAPGVATFATPAPMTFPNVFNAAPGTQLNFLSFDHTTGRLVIEGTATVSADGLYVTTDPGTGVTHPGWHGLTPPGAEGDVQSKLGKERNREDQCSPRKILEDMAGISLGLGGTIAAVSGAPLVAGVAAVGGLAFLAADLYNEGWTLQSANEVVGDAFDAVGILFAETKQSVGRPVKLSRILTDPILSPKFNKAARQLAKKVGQFSEGAAKVFEGVGNFLQGYDLGGEIAKCVVGGGSAARFSPAALAAAGVPPTDAILSYLNQFDAAGSSVMDAVTDLIATKLAPHLPSDRYVILVSDGQNLHGIEFDGSDYIDPTTGAALNIPISTLLDDNLLTDPTFRDRALTIANGCNTLKSLLTESNPGLKACRAQIDGVMAAAHASLSENVTPAAPVNAIFYRVTDFQTGATIASGMTSSSGQLQFFGADQTAFLLQIYDPLGGTYGEQILRSGASGKAFGQGFDGIFDLIALPDDPATDPDSDGDGLGDLVEQVIGTDPHKWSTAGDGISDGAKVRQGLDPLSGRGFPTGLIASLPTPGTAREVVLEGSTINSGQQTAYLALGSQGLGIVNASQFQTPILIGQLALPGDATDVAVDPNLQVAVVAGNTGGLHFVNVADSAQPSLLQTIVLSANHVKVVDGVAYAAAGPQLISYDMANLERLQTLTLGGGNITGLAQEGPFLYTMDAGRVLRVIDIGGESMVARGSLTLPAGGGKLFVGNGIAYAAAADGVRGGFATATVSNPDSPTLLSGVDDASVEGGAIAANGSGLAVAVGYVRGPQGQSLTALDVMNVSDPANTGAFLTRFNLPVTPLGVAIGGGIAFVADGTAGLQVVNYLPFDNQGVAPVVTLTALPPDLDTNTPGLQLLEGSFIGVGAQVSDDVQVRNVELLIDGTATRNDVSFPFELTGTLPILASGVTNVTLQVRATDTGGNVGLSAPVAVQLVPDTFPPQLLSINPPDGALRGLAFHAVTVRFSEPLDPATVSAGAFTLAGPGGAVAPQSIQLLNNGATVQLDYPALTAGPYQIIISGPSVTDRSGNPLGAGNVTSAFEIREATSVWTSTTGGFWDNPANWDGVLPGPTDDVIIDVPADVTITNRQGTTTVRSLRTKNAFVLSGGTLIVSSVEMDDTFTFSGGTLMGASVVTGPGGGPMLISSGMLDGVTLNGVLDAGNTVNAAHVTITNGLVLNGTALVGNPTNSSYGRLDFAGSQTLGGSGVVIFGNRVNASYNALRLLLAATTLTNGPAILVRGQNGTLGYASLYGGSTSVSVVNQGTISADVTNGTIFLTGQNFSNAGTTEARNGGALTVNSSGWHSTGNLGAFGGTLTLNNTWSLSGQFTVTNGTVNLGGSGAAADLAPLRGTGGTISFLGLLGNAANTLVLDGTIGTWTLNGGSVLGGTVQTTNGASLVCANSANNRLDGVTLSGALDVGNSISAADLTITNGLVLNGTALVGNPTNSSYGEITFAGSQALSGSGTVIFGNRVNAGYNALRLSLAGTTLTNGPTNLVRGQNGAIGYAGAYGGPSTVSVVNQGVISADVNGGTISLAGQNFSNAGTAEARNGGTLIINTSGWDTTGNLNAVGSTLTLNNAWSFAGHLNLTNSSLNLSGSGAAANLALVRGTGATLTLSALLENTGNTLVLDGAVGTWTLDGGAVRSGTIQTINGARLLCANDANNRLDGVTFNGELDVGNSLSISQVVITNGLVLNGTARVGNPTNSSYGGMNFHGSQALSGNGTVIFGARGNAGYNVLRPVLAGTTLTNSPTILVRGQNGTIGYASPWGGSTAVGVVNQGTISADVSGGTFYINGQTFSNAGTAEARNGGTLVLNSSSWNTAGNLNVVDSTLTLNNAWSIAGILSVTNATVNLTGTGLAADLAHLRGSGGAMNLSAALDNSANTLTLDGAIGTWTLLGGSLRAGTVTTLNGARLICANDANNRLDGVTLNGELDVGNSLSISQVVITNGLVLNGTARVGNPTNSWYGGMNFHGSQALSGNGTVIFGARSTVGYNVLRPVLAGTTLTNSPTILVRGQNGTIGYASPWGGSTAVGVVNQGTISADVGGGTFYLSGQTFLNTGLAAARNGGTIVANSGTWSTTSNLTIVDSTLTLNSVWSLSGNFSLTNSTLNLGGSGAGADLAVLHGLGGSINFDGTLDNTANTLYLDGAVGTWTLAGGTLRGGTLATLNGAHLICANDPNNRLDGLTLNGELDVGNSLSIAQVVVTNGLVLNGTARVGSAANASWYGVMHFHGSQTLSGTGTVVFGLRSTVGYNAVRAALAATTLTLGPNTTVRGQNGTIGYASPWGGSAAVSVVNDGTISADVSSGTIYVRATPFINNGTTNQLNGGTLLINP